MTLDDETVKLQPWVIALLITVLLTMSGVLFTAGSTYNTVQYLKERVDIIERRLERAEERDRVLRGLDVIPK